MDDDTDDGIDCYQILLTCRFDADGYLDTHAEVIAPEGSDYPSLTEVLGSMELGKLKLITLYDEDEDE